MQSIVQQIPANNSTILYTDGIEPKLYNDNVVVWLESFIPKPQIQGNYLPYNANTDEYFIRSSANDRSISLDYAPVDWSQCNTVLRPITEFIGCAYGHFGASTPSMCAR